MYLNVSIHVPTVLMIWPMQIEDIINKQIVIRYIK